MNNHLRIAIADDDSVSREFLLRMLLRLGHDVVCVAEDGRQLADYCLQSPPDLVIRTSCRSLTESRRRLKSLCNICPIVLLSGCISLIEQPDHVQVWCGEEAHRRPTEVLLGDGAVRYLLLRAAKEMWKGEK
jgi:CheY-like chemotaxis protein